LKKIVVELKIQVNQERDKVETGDFKNAATPGGFSGFGNNSGMRTKLK
jgi:hypothetical protein